MSYIFAINKSLSTLLQLEIFAIFIIMNDEHMKVYPTKKEMWSIMLQDTLKSSPPENRVMKRASLIGIMTTTLFYVLCGCLGYAAFGNDAPGNFLTGFGFYEPFWLIDFANVCIAVHLIGAYQVNNC